ncbi:MAG TPA: hypothetical protein VGE72_11590, partial [Azospirillum sp.]
GAPVPPPAPVASPEPVVWHTILGALTVQIERALGGQPFDAEAAHRLLSQLEDHSAAETCRGFYDACRSRLPAPLPPFERFIDLAIGPAMPERTVAAAQDADASAVGVAEEWMAVLADYDRQADDHLEGRGFDCGRTSRIVRLLETPKVQSMLASLHAEKRRQRARDGLEPELPEFEPFVARMIDVSWAPNPPDFDAPPETLAQILSMGEFLVPGLGELRRLAMDYAGGRPFDRSAAEAVAAHLVEPRWMDVYARVYGHWRISQSYGVPPDRQYPSFERFIDEVIDATALAQVRPPIASPDGLMECRYMQ